MPRRSTRGKPGTENGALTFKIADFEGIVSTNGNITDCVLWDARARTNAFVPHRIVLRPALVATSKPSGYLKAVLIVSVPEQAFYRTYRQLCHENIVVFSEKARYILLIEMVGGGSSAGSAAGGFYNAITPSETDGETFDGEDGFEEYEEWDYGEMFSTLSKNVKTFVLQPLVVGAAAAFGMSVGYAMFDATASLFSRKSSPSKSR